MRKTKEEAEITRKKIIKTAIKIFSKNGYTATKLEEIAKKVGVTRGAIYWHFKNKQELFSAICKENQSKMMATIEQIKAEGHPPLAALKKGMITILDKFESDKEFREIEELLFKTQITGQYKYIKPNSKVGDEPGLSALLDILTAAKSDGTLRKDLSPESVTYAIASFFFGIMSFWFINPSAYSMKEKADEFIDIFLHGIEINKK